MSRSAFRVEEMELGEAVRLDRRQAAPARFGGQSRICSGATVSEVNEVFQGRVSSSSTIPSGREAISEVRVVETEGLGV